MGKKKQNTLTVPDSNSRRSRHIKYLLYEDNELHMQVLDKIKDDKFPYIGIRHYILDFDGNVITEESGKPHFHIYQEYESAVYTSACAKRYGLITDAGLPDCQFCRTVTGRFANALVYLTHLNCPEKESYPDTDLFGWSNLKRDYQTAKLAYLDKNIDLRTALYALAFWVENDKRGEIITANDIIQFMINSPYLRFRNERLFLDLVAEHNKKIWAAEARERMEGYAAGQIQLNRASGFGAIETDIFGIEGLRDD